MDDRKLLALAAKAAGYLNWTPSAEGLHIETGSSRGGSGFYWNPLTDDGDALRLAVKLRFGVTVNKYEIIVTQFGETEAQENIDNDPYAATRRAIVRTAAEIGKTK